MVELGRKMEEVMERESLPLSRMMLMAPCCEAAPPVTTAAMVSDPCVAIDDSVFVGVVVLVEAGGCSRAWSRESGSHAEGEGVSLAACGRAVVRVRKCCLDDAWDSHRMYGKLSGQ